MTKNLVLSAQVDDDTFLAQLNQATGHQGSIPVPPTFKFNGETGQFQIEKSERTEDNKPIFENIGESARVHIVLVRKMIQSSFAYNEKNTDRYFSREFEGNYFELYRVDENNNKKIAYKGFYKKLKESDDPKDQLLVQNLQYVVVIYGYLITAQNEPKPIRMKISGSKLSNWFDYQNSFRNSNPALFVTAMSRGKQQTKGKVDYYEINFTKDTVLAKEVVVKHVTAIKQYLEAYYQAINSQEEQSVSEPLTSEQLPPPAGKEPDPIDDEDIDVSNIPM